MNSTIKEILGFIKENDVKFIRLAFCDALGAQKNISIMPLELLSAFENGVSFDASAVKGFREIKRSDLFLFPDPSTLTVLPWRPGPGRVVRFYCDIKRPDGTIYENDGRNVLRRVVERGEKLGLDFKIGAECEFYLFKTNDEGEPTKVTMDKGGYMDISPLDKGENIRREICLCLEEMGIMPESSHHEQGPGQNEIDFKYDDALACADNLLVFKSVVKAISARNGVFASFMAKPLENFPGNGMHVNVSAHKNGKNIFENFGEDSSDIAKSFVAGILDKIEEITVFLNPQINSYDRLGYFEAPKYVAWGKENRSGLVRIPASVSERARVELRSPDPACNPYLAFALVLACGIYGIENNLKLPSEMNFDLFSATGEQLSELKALPNSLEDAIKVARKSEFLKEILGNNLVERYLNIKEAEVSSFKKSNGKESFYMDNYFDIT